MMAPGQLDSRRTLHHKLEAFWRMEEASGNARVDAVNGRNLAESNASNNRAGKIGNAVDLVRTASGTLRIVSGSATAFNPGSSPFSISCWALADSFASDNVIVSKWDSGINHRGWMLWRTSADNLYHFRLTSDGTNGTAVTVSGATAATGVAVHFACWWDGARAYIQVNGGTPNSVAFAGPVHGTNAPLTVGAFVASAVPQTYWDGYIDALGYWSRVLTDVERQRLWNDGNGREYPFR